MGDAIWEVADRRWFSDNPGKHIHARQSYAGEFDAGQVETYSQFCMRYAGYSDKDILGIGAYTVVVRIDDMTRLRLPYWRADLADADCKRMPVEAQLAGGGDTTTLSQFVEQISAAAAASVAVTERYLDELLPAFMVTAISYAGDRGPAESDFDAMIACFDATPDETIEDSHAVRPATENDHDRHATAHPAYEPGSFPAVLVVQPFPGMFFRMPFPRVSMAESDNYRFRVSTPAGDGSLGDYLTQVRQSLRFACRAV